MKAFVMGAVIALLFSVSLDADAQYTCTGSVFNDVNLTTTPFFCGFIEELWKRELSLGPELTTGLACVADNPATVGNERQFCLNGSFTKAQTAAFMVDAMDQMGDITAVNAGSGLSGGGVSGDLTLSVNTSIIQSRVTGTCPAGSAIRQINQNGSVVCQSDGPSALGTVTVNVPGPGDETINMNTSGIGVKGVHGAATGVGAGVEGVTNSTGAGAFGLLGTVTQTNAGSSSAGVRGINNGTGAYTIGVWGSDGGSGWGVYGFAPSGNGVRGFSDSGTGVFGYTATGYAAQFFGKTQINGLVGIGTGSPAANLHLNTGTFLLGSSVAKQLRLRDTGSAVDVESLGVPLFVNNGGTQPIYLFGSRVSTSGRLGIGTGQNVPAADLHVNNGVFLIGNSAAKQLRLRNNGSAVDIESIGVPLYVNFTTGQPTYLMGGNVGVGTTAPAAKLHVAGSYLRVDGLGNEQAYIGGDGFGGDVQIGSLNSNVRAVSVYNWGSNTWMDLAARSIIIKGGADLSERFDIRTSSKATKPLPGMVVSIDPREPGKLVISESAYDRKVAGIISGAGGVHPGMLMGQEGSEADGSNPVALTGRVYCWVDASNGAIEPGDLLTTSEIPGHAMKVTDHTKAPGAVIGKAMSSLDSGKGLVLVLVSLQ